MLEFLTQSTWADRIGWMLVHSLWQFAAVAILAMGLHRILHRRSAATRYRALLAAMCIMVAVPVATWFWPGPADAPAVAAKVGPVENSERVSSAQRVSPPERGNDTMAVATLPAELPLGLASKPQAEPRHLTPAPTGIAASLSLVQRRVQPWLPEIVLVWLVGVLLAACRLLLSWFTVRRLRTTGVSPVGDAVHKVLERTAKRLRLAQAVEVLQSALVKTPVVIGHFRPAVLLPLCVVTGLPEGQLELILAHELAHICRHDYLINLLQTLVETLFFYHPAVWWLSRQIRNERENCCDDVAMATVGNRADYGRALLAIEELRGTSTALSLAAHGGSLLTRIRRIAGCEPAPRVVGGGGILGLILVSIAIWAAVTWGAAPMAEKPEPKGATAPPANAATGAWKPGQALDLRAEGKRGTVPLLPFDPSQGSGPHDPVPVKADPGTTLDSIFKRLADEEKRYDMLEVSATVSYRHLNLREPLVNNSAEGDKFVTCMSSKTGDRSVFAGDRLYHEENRENKMADGTTSSTRLRQAYDGQWTRQDRQFTSSNPELKVDRWTTIGLDQKDELRLLRPHTILFHDDRINGQLLSAFFHSGWFDERDRSAMTVEYVGDERIDGLHCHKLKCALPSRGKVNGFFLVWLARDRNLLAVRHEWHKPAFSLIRPTGVSYVEQFREIRPGVWFPFLATHLAYRKHGVGSDDPRLLQWRRDTIVEKVTPSPAVNSKLFSQIEVPKDALVTVLDRDGRRIGEFRQPQSGNIEIAANRLLAMRQEARTSEEDKYDPKDATASDRKARIDAALRVLRSDPPPSQKERIEAALEILRNYRAFQTNTAKWATAIRELIMIGKPAVPKLIEELDRTDHLADRGQLLRALGFVLRGIGDPRAVPALIRSLPFTLQPSYSDLGCSVADQELQGFMEAHDRDRNDHATHFSFGRPINEVLSALQKLCGIEAVVPREQYVQEFKDIHHIFLSGKSESDRPRQELFLRFAETWADWWAQNWRFYVKDESEAQVEQTRNALKRFTKPETVPAQPRPPAAAKGQSQDDINIRWAAAAAAVAKAVCEQDEEANRRVPGSVPQAVVQRHLQEWQAMERAVQKAKKVGGDIDLRPAAAAAETIGTLSSLRTSVMRLEVVDAAGKPIPGAALKAQRSDGDATLVARSLVVHAPARIIGATGVTLDRAERKLYVKKLEDSHRSPERLLRVGVVDKTGKPIPGATIKVMDRSDKSMLTAETLTLDVGGLIQATGLKTVVAAPVAPSPSPPVIIVDLPRPNSGTFSFEQAESRKSEMLSNAPTPPLEEWKNPYMGFCVHIYKDDSITVYNHWPKALDKHKKPAAKLSVADVKKMADGLPLLGNPAGILITSDLPFKDSKTIHKVLNALFIPSVQLFYARSDDGLVQFQTLQFADANLNATDAGLEHLRGLTQLRDLRLDGGKVTDAGLAHLQRLSQLRSLQLGNTQVTDAGLVHLQELNQLQILVLNDTKVTDAGLVHLQGLKQLQGLGLGKTQVSDQGIKKLQRVLPNCKITR